MYYTILHALIQYFGIRSHQLTEAKKVFGVPVEGINFPLQFQKKALSELLIRSCYTYRMQAHLAKTDLLDCRRRYTLDEALKQAHVCGNSSVVLNYLLS